MIISTSNSELSTEKNIEICVVSGSEGPHIELGNYRIAGPKAWGGGQILYQWKVSLSDIAQALRGKATVTQV